MFGNNFLRLGVACAVYDEQGRVLLSRRGDLDVWNLPTGRLDAHEPATIAATREAREETGIRAEVVRPVGLYYLAATRRLNILFAARAVGGEVVSETAESRDNRYFALGDIPDEMFGAYMAQDAAFAKTGVVYIHRTPPAQIRQVRRKLAWRWVKNLLRGQPEPRHVRFDVTAVAVIWEPVHHRLLAVAASEGVTLPRVGCPGEVAPWVALKTHLNRFVRADVKLKWVGLWQHLPGDHVEFVFTGVAPAEDDIPPDAKGGADWMVGSNAPLIGRDVEIVRRTRAIVTDATPWIEVIA